MKSTSRFITYKSASLILTVWDSHLSTITDLYAIHQGKGHGTKVLKKTTRFLDANKLTALLEVISGNPERISHSKLQKFYEKFGFEAVNPGEQPILMERKPKE